MASAGTQEEAMKGHIGYNAKLWVSFWRATLGWNLLHIGSPCLSRDGSPSASDKVTLWLRLAIEIAPGERLTALVVHLHGRCNPWPA